LDELEVLQKMEFIFPNYKIQTIYKIIFTSLIKNNYSVEELINSIIINFAFTSKLSLLIKYEIYLIILKYFLDLFGAKINFNETQINIEDNISLDLIIDLFNQNKMHVKLFIQSILILKYEYFKDSLVKCDMPKIKEGINNTIIKLKNTDNNESVLLIEKLVLIFIEEIEKLNSTKMKKKKSKKNKNANEFNIQNVKTDYEKPNKIIEND
jgi:hypothetical protein